jgi:eight-cysteine-cluster-containing protein
MTRVSIQHRRLAPCAVVLAALAVACEKPTPPNGPTTAGDGGQAVTRQPAVPVDHPLFDRFEGTGFPNDCTTDAACHQGGCSGEVCSADPGVVTTCEVLAVALPAGTACGCVESQCRWWNADGITLPPVPSQPQPGEEATCATVLCQPPTVCLEYYGVAGPRGPLFVSCEIPCDPTARESSCPDGMSCITIADGPGSVCRPRE